MSTAKLPCLDRNQRCGCGRYFACHYYFEEEEDRASKTADVRWSISHSTATFPTDSYGVLKFCGVADCTKAQYVRLDFTSSTDDIWQLLVHAFGFEPPKLLISIHGGGNDFEMAKALKREFQSGLLQVARTTSAWVITSGVRAGVTKHVAAALCGSTSSRSKPKFVVIGIAPWGLIRHSEKLIGENLDNGTMGRSGAELLLRRRFEEFLRQKTMLGSARLMPLVCLIIGGGRLAVHSAANYVCSSPPVPVVVCKHTGRAADLLSSAYEDFLDRGHEEEFKRALVEDIKAEFEANDDEAEFWFKTIEKCASKRNLLTVFDGFSHRRDASLDCVILSALLKARNMSAVDRLNLLLTWNREDMMHAEFEQTIDWKEGSLDPVFMEALMYNRVDIVRLLLNNGVVVEQFLTPERLEMLYNTDKGPPNTLSYLIQDVIKDVGRSYSYRLPDIGLIIEKLIGYGYRAAYRRREFRTQYQKKLNGFPDHNSQILDRGVDLVAAIGAISSGFKNMQHFRNPFHDLFLWAVLTNRLDMAFCMWQHGEEPLVKALIGHKLMKSMMKEAKEDFLEMELYDELKKGSEDLAYDLLEQCYQMDDDLTMRLLTYELRNWSRKNCISLAALANHKKFIGHPCCQLLLGDLWLGGLRVRKNVNLKILMAVLLPPMILTLTFKTREELLLQAQTAEEHHDNVNEEVSDTDSDSGESVYDTEIDVESYAETPSRGTPKVSYLRKFRSRRLSSYTDPRLHLTEEAKAVEATANKGLAARQRSRRDTQTEGMGSPPAAPIEKSASTTFPFGASQFRKQELSTKKKIREFYSSPIASFWSWTLAYFVFLTAFSYVVLVAPTVYPTLLEYYLLFYIVTFFMDLMRKLLTQDSKTLHSKVKTFLKHSWDKSSCLACVMFMAAFALRYDTETLSLARILLKINIVFWYLRVLHILTVSAVLGQYITIYGKMVVKMILLCSILFVVLLSFGIFRQSVTYPNEQFNWTLVRNVVYKPYFMLYGELYAEEIDTCGDENRNCVSFGWLTPLFMTIYLLLSIVVFLNMMIAAFNFVFTTVSAHSHLIWKFHKYEQVMDYEQQPFLPPPFVVVVHVYRLARYLFVRMWRNKKTRRLDHSLKLFLSDADVSKLHDFESQCMEDLLTKKRNETELCSEKQIESVISRLNETNNKIAQLQKQFQRIEGTLNYFDKRFHVFAMDMTKNPKETQPTVTTSEETGDQEHSVKRKSCVHEVDYDRLAEVVAPTSPKLSETGPWRKMARNHSMLTFSLPMDECAEALSSEPDAVDKIFQKANADESASKDGQEASEDSSEEVNFNAADFSKDAADGKE